MPALYAYLFLAISLSINITIASESLENTIVVHSQGEKPLLIVGKKDPRRRGEYDFPPDVRVLNVCKADRFCYIAPEKLHFWLPKRKRSGQTDSLVITNIKTSNSITLSWKASDATWVWPLKEIPIYSGVPYLIQLKKKEWVYFSKLIVLYQIPAHFKTTAKKTAWMKQKGCNSQVERQRGVIDFGNEQHSTQSIEASMISAPLHSVSQPEVHCH